MAPPCPPEPSREHFQLVRASDGLVYEFDRAQRADGSVGYRRREPDTDRELWIHHESDWGWVARDEAGELAGIAWGVPPSAQRDWPPEGIWVSRKGARSYVYQLQYLAV